jgi:hypothetical protein
VTRYTRRGTLAAGASTLAALAGCSSLPFTDDDGSDDLPSYDKLELASAARENAYDPPEWYPGPVPSSLLETHRSRTLDLLDGVPEEPSFPNEAVTERLRRHRERAVEFLPEEVPERPGLGDVADWRRVRGDAAEVAFAYRAAAGNLDDYGVEQRRLQVRNDYRTARADWTYRGENAVDALATSYELESELAAARRDLTPERTVPTDPRSAPFEAGEVTARVEEARAHLDTATVLRDAHREAGMADYWTEVAGAAGRLVGATRNTVEHVAPFLFEDVDAREVFDREVDRSPARELFARGVSSAKGNRRQAEAAADRGDYALAVVWAGRSIVATLALARGVDAVRDGDHGVPPDTDAVLAQREAAVDALRGVESVPPEPLTLLLAEPMRSIEYADGELAEDPSDRGVVRLAGEYAYAEYVLDALPAVVDRVGSELGVNT